MCINAYWMTNFPFNYIEYTYIVYKTIYIFILQASEPHAPAHVIMTLQVM